MHLYNNVMNNNFVLVKKYHIDVFMLLQVFTVKLDFINSILHVEKSVNNNKIEIF